MQRVKIFVTACCIATVMALAAAPILFSQPAGAMPAFTKQTGKPCVQCHQNANGTGGLTDFGQKFKANGNK
jgi:hypothetical protein